MQNITPFLWFDTQAEEAMNFFVRPKTKFLEVCVFLDRPLKVAQVRKVVEASKSKTVSIMRITHRDEVEPPITDWLQEAYDLSGAVPARKKAKSVGKKR